MNSAHGAEASHATCDFSEIFRNTLGYLATSILRRKREISETVV